MSDNVRLWMGAFKSMSIMEHGYGSLYSVNEKPPLHPIIHVYTRKCAANIVEKYKHSLVVE